ncbi:MAG: hypothetical protein JSV84_14355 [Gemmatimonadota bacterium]|nr:MAG: hypothetical protein JSV84_14355 [Gemmatimonadota bacterium]
MKSLLQRKRFFIGGSIFLCLVFAGCLLITKTFTIVVYIEASINSEEDNIGSEYFTLEGNDVWEDHRDEINSIESVEFAAKITNQEDTEATGQIYISDNGALNTLSAIQNNASLVLKGIVIPPNQTVVIEREESTQYLMNFEELKAQVESGDFYVYAIAENVPFHIVVAESLAVIVSFTAGN